eukprot:6197536-Pleurochrysis_carterae.AAC.6
MQAASIELLLARRQVGGGTYQTERQVVAVKRFGRRCMDGLALTVLSKAAVICCWLFAVRARLLSPSLKDSIPGLLHCSFHAAHALCSSCLLVFMLLRKQVFKCTVLISVVRTGCGARQVQNVMLDALVTGGKFIATELADHTRRLLVFLAIKDGEGPPSVSLAGDLGLASLKRACMSSRRR